MSNMLDIARYLKLAPAQADLKRSMPRGTLRKDFWDRQFAQVEALIEPWGYDVVLYSGAYERVDLGAKTVHVNSACHPETKFYTLLHEVGHILIRKDWKRFSMAYPNYLDSPDGAVDGRRQRRKTYRIGLIAEEIEAWKRGRAWAERQGMYIDMFKYDSDANSALMSYIEWIAGVQKQQTRAGRKAAKVRKTRNRKVKQIKGLRRPKKSDAAQCNPAADVVS